MRFIMQPSMITANAVVSANPIANGRILLIIQLFSSMRSMKPRMPCDGISWSVTFNVQEKCVLLKLYKYMSHERNKNFAYIIKLHLQFGGWILFLKLHTILIKLQVLDVQQVYSLHKGHSDKCARFDLYPMTIGYFNAMHFACHHR